MSQIILLLCILCFSNPSSNEPYINGLRLVSLTIANIQLELGLCSFSRFCFLASRARAIAIKHPINSIKSNGLSLACYYNRQRRSYVLLYTNKLLSSIAIVTGGIVSTVNDKVF